MTDPGLAQLALTRLPSLQRLALLLAAGDRTVAEDMIQDMFVKLLTRRRGSEVVAVDAYLRRVLVNEYLSRRRRKRVGEVPMTVDTETADPASRVDDQMAVLDSLRHLTPVQRTVLVLRYLEDWPDEEIARRLGRRPSTVRSDAARGLRSMRLMLGSVDSETAGRSHGHGEE